MVGFKKIRSYVSSAGKHLHQFKKKKYLAHPLAGGSIGFSEKGFTVYGTSNKYQFPNAFNVTFNLLLEADTRKYAVKNAEESGTGNTEGFHHLSSPA